jgi:hypothetical protein
MPRRLSLFRLALFASLLGFASLATSACGQAARSVAHLPGRSASSGPRPAPSTRQGDEEMLRFTNCMRAHGVAMPDPVHVPGHDGLRINLPTKDASTARAYSACDHFIAEFKAAKQSGAQALSSRTMNALIAYAQCMRGRGIPLLDPDRYGNLNLGHVRGLGDASRYSPQFATADSACRRLLPVGRPDNGSGP